MGWSGVFRMLAKLREMFRGGTSAGKGRVARVNLGRRYTIMAETSQGSMSRVYRAVDNSNGRTVCLKVQIPSKNEAAAQRAERTERPSEGEIASRVVHPHVVRTYDHGVSTKGEHFVVMEFVDG